VNALVQYRLTGRHAKEISAGVEAGVRSGALVPGDRLPSVRALAAELGVSPATVAAAYAELRRRGITDGAGRGGTRIRPAPPVSRRVYLNAPEGTRDLITGGPDPGLLPAIPARAATAPARLYERAPVAPRLRELAAAQFADDGIDPANLAVTGGALDAIERVLSSWITPGSRVLVEDPGHAVTFDLVAAMGFTAVPVPIDDLGIVPGELARALAGGADALITTPRAQAATGAAWNSERAAALREVLTEHPSLGVIEDDHAGPVAGVPGLSVCAALPAEAGGTAWAARNRWVTVRSVSKSLGPDLRLAVLAGDEETLARVTGRQALGTGWVSYLIQETVADLWSNADVRRGLAEAAEVYLARGRALRSALAERGVTTTGRSGLTCWVRLDDEDGVAGALAGAGWAVAPGRRFRIAAPSGIRVSYATLDEEAAPAFADDLARVLRRPASRLD
jgi:DNA-binding transcriptional MocR family regulator